MPRPRRKRRLRHNQKILYFKPQGVPMAELEQVTLSHEEIEALKLHELDGLDHTDAAEQMSISQPTFGRTINSAYKKIADAIINGKALKIE